uniref:Uncharacterized protein n=1 Tax=Anopheles stephensi TaxID=30069 RepID=A0A182YHH3_ANOST
MAPVFGQLLLATEEGKIQQTALNVKREKSEESDDLDVKVSFLKETYLAKHMQKHAEKEEKRRNRAAGGGGGGGGGGDGSQR